MILATALGRAHEIGAWVVVLGNAFVGAWALAAHWREPLRTKALWVATAIAEVAIFVQVILGVAYQKQSDVEPGSLHQLYGFASLFAVGIVYAYRQQLKDKIYLLYGLGGFFLMGMGIRAMVLHN